MKGIIQTSIHDIEGQHREHDLRPRPDHAVASRLVRHGKPTPSKARTSASSRRKCSRSFPENVTVGDDANHTLGLTYTEFIPVIVRAIQQLAAKISTSRPPLAPLRTTSQRKNSRSLGRLATRLTRHKRLPRCLLRDQKLNFRRSCEGRSIPARLRLRQHAISSAAADNATTPHQ